MGVGLGAALQGSSLVPSCQHIVEPIGELKMAQGCKITAVSPTQLSGRVVWPCVVMFHGSLVKHVSH